MSNSAIDSHPFRTIALALSGGGYRAAGFHLGVLDMLHRLQLLEHVTILSTVSGGSFTGASYALAIANGIPFPAFLNHFSAFLRQTPLPSLWLEALTQQENMNAARHRNLITAAASVYNRELFGNAQFGQLLNTPTHLREIIINATEFHTGLSFRFRKSPNSRALIGNGNLSVPRSVAEKLMLGDIVAASSCFPGGFEPIAFPDDFTWPNGTDLAWVQSQLSPDFKGGVALMDGGIYDNQGLDSIDLANDNPQPGNEISLLLISDTDTIQPSEMPLFRFPAPPRRHRLTLRWLFFLGWGVFGLSVLSTVALLARAIADVLAQQWINVLYSAIPLLFNLIVTAIVFVLWIVLRRQLLLEIRKRLQGLGVNLWATLRHLTLSEVLDLIQLRALSLVTMSGSIVLKRVRSLVFKTIYSKSRYRNRIISNLIYELKPNRRSSRRANWLQPSPALSTVADQATATPTALWFEPGQEAKQLNTLLACGQFTTCFNLLDYILRQYGDDLSQYPPDVLATYTEARQLWDALQTDPYKFIPPIA